MAILGSLLTIGCGSQSRDIPSDVPLSENPLPACPGSPNCIRTTKVFEVPAAKLFPVAIDSLCELNPKKLILPQEEYTIKSVFKVMFFNDDMTIKLTQRDSATTLVHLRSASRVGQSDLGVNRRRVNTFIKNLRDQLTNTTDKMASSNLNTGQ
ncbi:DUF1499 domain-containing protein [Fodinibius halophilus]|uniref:DUF1499 domain-containing protein n=1 Tax=Fodinibius halophilus TaxID=1736908 RepID=A0A6M1T2E5_9BACT|nr:DUF1499 domain-containing protein [Fodinibius halophilus]NGP86793.1 DUF1499 domain-containing protein [Fodinibius halophilus]